MSLDIDMKAYGAGANPGQAAAVQPTETNSYMQEYTDEYPVMRELLTPPEDRIAPEGKAEEVVAPEPSPQELNFKALREEVDRIKAEREAEKRDHQLQLDMLRANASREEAPRKQKEMFDGVDGDYVPNVNELRREWQARESMYQERLEELEVQTRLPDYVEVMEKYTIPLVKQKPHLAEGIRGAQNKAMFAYELGKLAQQGQLANQPPPAAPQPEAAKPNYAERIIENSRKPGTLSGAGGQGALSKADYFATMSDQEFMRMASRNLEGI
jgi:hypothetical protein